MKALAKDVVLAWTSGIPVTYLEVQGSYNEARSVVAINHIKAP